MTCNHDYKFIHVGRWSGDLMPGSSARKVVTGNVFNCRFCLKTETRNIRVFDYLDADIEDTSVPYDKKPE